MQLRATLATPKNLKRSRDGAGNPGKERLHPHVYAESKIKMHHFVTSKRTCLVQKMSGANSAICRDQFAKKLLLFLNAMFKSDFLFILFYRIQMTNSL